MNDKITNLFKSTRRFLGKHSPEILTGIGVTGMITSTVLAVKATPKALELIKTKKEELGYPNDSEEKLTFIDTVKVAWKPYIPAAALCIVSTSCIIGASAVNYKRNAALATAYAISERTLLRYRDKVIDVIGDKKEKEIKDKIAQDIVDNNKKSSSQVIVTSKGNTLLMDALSGRYFRSDIDKIKKIVNELNARLLNQNYISLNEYYYEIDLDPVKNGDSLGWNVSNGLIELDISTCLAENDEPCIVIDFITGPKYDFDKLL